jgi:hypothetical protein
LDPVPLAVAPPLHEPRRGTVHPPRLFNNTATYRRQDEPFLRSRTLYLYLTFHLYWLIYAI